MMGSLQLQYNRGRQAVITNELIDIITVRHSFSSHHKRFTAKHCHFFSSISTGCLCSLSRCIVTM